METERTGVIKFKGIDPIIVGKDLKPGDVAPEFVSQNSDWLEFIGLKDTSGKVRIIAAVPSLETAVCDRETRRFNLEATSLSEDIVVLVVSMDLPYTQKRWCGATGIDRVITLSDHLNAEFGKKYGCLMKDFRLLRRAVFVVDRQDKVVYSAYMPEIGVEPDYDAVMGAAKGALLM
jgi:thiol peroxidase